MRKETNLQIIVDGSVKALLAVEGYGQRIVDISVRVSSLDGGADFGVTCRLDHSYIVL
jgi:hypothetical protein